MKKVKIMLVAITVFAVVGGALAFKAKSFTTRLYLISDNGRCVITTDTYTKLVNGVEVQASTEYDGACTTFTTTNIEP
jgi:hypothetical protein